MSQLTKLLKSYHRKAPFNILRLPIFCCLILLTAIFCVPMPVKAIEVPDLYEATVRVSDQSRQARRTAQKEAFKKVLIKVSGNDDVLKNPAVKNAIRKAGEYLRQFEFVRDDQNESALQAFFDEGKISRLLRQESLPIWGKRRPSILLWMVGEDPNNAARQVVSKESYAQLMTQITSVSKQRGLLIIFPLYDIEDNQKVSVSDVWGHFYSHISQFSYRYQTDSIIISRLWYETDDQEQQQSEPLTTIDTSIDDQIPDETVINKGQWRLEWRLYESDKQVDVNTISGRLDDVVEQLVHNMADRYASAYAVDSSKLENSTQIVLTVKGVAQIGDLIAAEKLLLSFSAVADVMLKTVNNDVAEFEIMLLGESLDLLQGMDLEQHFEKIYDPLAQVNEDLPLEYRWIP